MSNVKTVPAKLQLLMLSSTGTWGLTEVPPNYPYLPVSEDDEKLASPNEVSRLRDGRYCSRHATVTDHNGQKFSLILAIDGKRRAMEGYKELGRQRSSGCGITLSSQRGTFISAHGIKICEYNQIFDTDALSDFSVLNDNTEHHMFFIDGPFELVTSRNAPAPNALRILTDPTFLEKIKIFLKDVVQKRPRGAILRELIERLTEERTHQREDHYHKMMDHVKVSLPERPMFQVTDVPQLKGKWFYEPALGEENFVGALFTLFAHLVDKAHPMFKYWNRPLTFKSYGIDAIACEDEDHLIDKLKYVEYKHVFSTDVEFNHPFSITSTIICWDFKVPMAGTAIGDNYDYVGTINGSIESGSRQIGFMIDDIHLKSGLNSIGNSIMVLSLYRLLRRTFKLTERKPMAKPAK
jgi:hypothetical protein